MRYETGQAMNRRGCLGKIFSYCVNCFDSTDGFLCCAGAVQSHITPIVSSCSSLAAGVLCRIFLSIFIHWKILLKLSFVIFRISYFPLGSLIHFQLNRVTEKDLIEFFFILASSFPNIIYWRCSNAHFWHLCVKRWLCKRA